MQQASAQRESDWGYNNDFKMYQISLKQAPAEWEREGR